MLRVTSRFPTTRSARNGYCGDIAVGNRMFLWMQDFDFAQI